MSIASFLGQAISDRRRYLGYSQEELSKKAGIHRAYLSDVERGLRNITLAVIDRLAHALQIPLSELVRQAEMMQDATSNTKAVQARTQDLRALCDELTTQLNALVKHAEEFKDIRDQSRVQLKQAKESAAKLKDRASKQRKMSADNTRRAGAVEEEEKRLTQREAFAKHREKFLDQRDSGPVRKLASRKRKKKS